MDEGVSITSAPPDVPDWNTIDRDILCPLCDYNLRGLVEPRCPECGHQSSWAQLFDPQHRWLFEHADKHKIRRFFRTFFTSQFPRYFWTRVQPIHDPRPRRLLIYWLTWVVVPIIAFTALFTYRVDYHYRQSRYSYQVYLPWNLANMNNPAYAPFIQQRGGPQAYRAWLMQISPPPTLKLAVSQTIDFDAYFLIRPIPILIGMLIWPWFTALVLMLFRQTMHQAQIKPIHVLRCAIYSADAMPLLAAIVLPIIIRRGEPYFYRELPVLALAIGAGLIVLTYRLWIAYRRYMRFPHAAATCLASQIIVALLLRGLYLFFGGY